MCLLGSVKAGASEAGATIWTDGSDEVQVTPVSVCVVGLPATSFNVMVRPNGAPWGQGNEMQVGVLTAATFVQDGVADEPIVTQRLFCAAPSELARLAASAEAVCAQTLTLPITN
jgi:hypothetical protein